MNITPTLPNPQHLPPDQERRMVSSVQPTRRTRDATDEPQPRRAPPGTEVNEQAALAARADALHRASPAADTGRAGRALAAYAEVADDTDRGELRRLLGFDAYA
jgi:hypothetical protein